MEIVFEQSRLATRVRVLQVNKSSGCRVVLLDRFVLFRFQVLEALSYAYDVASALNLPMRKA